MPLCAVAECNAVQYTVGQSTLSRHGNHVMPPCCAAVRYGACYVLDMCSIWARYGLDTGSP